MKTLSSALEAAQQASSATPYVRARFADYWGYARRARPQRVYTGAEDEGPAAVAIASDGSLVRLRRERDVATVEYQVGESADDAEENNGGMDLNVQSPTSDDANDYQGFRFQSVAIAQGAAIVEAVLRCVFHQDNPEGTVFGDDADDSAQFTSSDNDISGRTSTTATTAVDLTGMGAIAGEFEVLADVTAIVQEIVNRGSWSSGNALSLLWVSGADTARDFGVRHWDYQDGSFAAKLEITYATSSPPAEAFVSRVASPGSGSTFSSWSSLDDEISALAGIALCADSDTLYAFLVDDDRGTIVMRTSTDDGASWSSRSTVVATGAVVTWLAAAAADDDDILLFYALNDGTVYAVRWGGSSWGSEAAWSNSVGKVTGLATAYLSDWQVVVCGWETGATATAARKVWACRYGDGVNQAVDTWGSLRVVADAGGTAGFEFTAPSVTWNDVFRLYYLESYSGDEAYDRVQWTTLDIAHDFNEEQWREPAPFDYEGTGGLAAIDDGSATMWLAAADGVWLAAVPAYSEVDADDDVVLARVRCDGDGARVELELDNSAGTYTSYGSGGVGALQRGARLELTPGYVTSSGEEVADTPYGYWVEEVQLVTGPRPRLRVVARDGWALLGTWRARRQFTWAAGDKTISQLLLFIVARAASPGPRAGRRRRR